MFNRPTLFPSKISRLFSSGSRRQCAGQIWTPDSRDKMESTQNKVSASKNKIDSQPNKLFNQIVGRIRFDGPMTVAQYMQELLTHPREGYYMNKDAFGSQGDFITSPEVSQMFGECLAIWILHEWNKMGSPLPLQLVELGPGRGTLMQDVLRTFMKITPESLNKISIHLVEASPFLRQMQEAVLCGSFHSAKTKPDHPINSKFGPTVEWHNDLSEVPRRCFSIFLTNEFFDAMPVHKFVRVNSDESAGSKVWREVLVDIEDDKNGETKLRFVRSRNKTPASQLISDADEFYADHDSAEISPKTGLVVKEMSERIVEFGGAALFADYGHDGLSTHGDTFRAFKNHKLHDPLVGPGTADVTCDVDFSYIRRHCRNDTLTYGPVTQRDFLFQLGIEIRRKTLLEHNSENEEVRKEIETSFDFLVDPNQMGERFKFFSIFPKTMEEIHQKFPPVGFYQTRDKQ